MQNTDASTQLAQLRGHYARQGGGPSGTITYPALNLPPGTRPLTVFQRIPRNTPGGTYDLHYELLGEGGVVCDEQFSRS